MYNIYKKSTLSSWSLWQWHLVHIQHIASPHYIYTMSLWSQPKALLAIAIFWCICGLGKHENNNINNNNKQKLNPKIIAEERLVSSSLCWPSAGVKGLVPLEDGWGEGINSTRPASSAPWSSVSWHNQQPGCVSCLPAPQRSHRMLSGHLAPCYEHPYGNKRVWDPLRTKKKVMLS